MTGLPLRARRTGASWRGLASFGHPLHPQPISAWRSRTALTSVGTGLWKGNPKVNDTLYGGPIVRNAKTNWRLLALCRGRVVPGRWPSCAELV
jgi:hypothetical protein